MQWINVNDKLPKDNERVLVFVLGDDEMCVASRLYDSWCSFPVCYDDSAVFGVTHWAPLPDAPKD
jgi:hypothetical protein